MTDCVVPAGKSDLLDLFGRIGFRPSPKRGQNFLIDPNMRLTIVDSAALFEEDVVLEIGFGTGSLTELLCREAGAVVAVEIDRLLFDAFQGCASRFPNLTLICGDIVTGHHDLNPEVEKALRARLAEREGRRLKVVANLPYSAGTPAIVALMTGGLPVFLMTLTVQKEIAERITAMPGTKDYGLLAVTVQAAAEARILRLAPPEVFWPRPKVHSAVVEIRPRAELAGRIQDRATFARIARALFGHRRKTIHNCLKSAGEEFGGDLLQALEVCGIDPQARGEALPVESIIQLANTALQWKGK